MRDEGYWTALHIVPILLMASLFLGLYYNLSIWFKVTDKTYYGTFISVSAAIITIVLNYTLIPYFGYEGSVVITLIVYFYMCLIAYISGRKHYPVNYNLKKLAFYFLITLVLLAVGWNIEFQNSTISQLIKEVPILLFAVIAYLSERKNLIINKN